MTTNPAQPDDPDRTPPPPPGAAPGVPPQHGPADAAQAGPGQPAYPPYGGQPTNAPHGAPYGGPPPAGAPYGGPPPAGAPYGGPPPAGGPYGGPQSGGAPHGGGSYGAPGGYSGPAAAYGPPQSPLSDSDQRTWATLAHVGGIFLELLAPLIVWLIFKDRGRFVDEQAKEALNFRISVLIGYLVGFVLTVIWIGPLIVFGVWVLSVVFAIMAAVATNKGEPYRYPVTLRVIS